MVKPRNPGDHVDCKIEDEERFRSSRVAKDETATLSLNDPLHGPLDHIRGCCSECPVANKEWFGVPDSR